MPCHSCGASNAVAPAQGAYAPQGQFAQGQPMPGQHMQGGYPLQGQHMQGGYPQGQQTQSGSDGAGKALRAVGTIVALIVINIITYNGCGYVVY